jgi:hypothetical protein
MKTAVEKAKELTDKYYIICQEFTEEIQCSIQATQCALVAVDEIINSNPHSNPMNTYGFSTMAYWQEVKQELTKQQNQ